MQWTDNAEELLEDRYLQRTGEGEVTETPDEMLHRVAKAVAMDKEEVPDFYRIMDAGDFLPNSPTLMNAGTSIGQLSACFVLPVEDDLGSIYQTIKEAALIWKSGGGTGFNFSNLRQRGAFVRSTQGRSKGPLSFIEVFDSSASTIEQGGRRPGANMALLRVDHPDIWEFIDAKREDGKFTNFNFSVGITEEFMKDLRAGDQTPLRDPRNGEVVSQVSTTKVWEALSEAAHDNGEPGVVFLDKINETDFRDSLGAMEAINPCGEQPLYPYESCNLGSINLANHMDAGDFNLGRLKHTVETAVRFLDNVITVNQYPLDKVANMTRSTRKIGLGVMGWAEALAMAGIPYDSDVALRMADMVMGYINRTAHATSQTLVEEKGAFPAWDSRIPEHRRNATLTTVAPTGSISQLAGTSFGIEPFYSLDYTHNGKDVSFDFDPENVCNREEERVK